MFVYHNYDRPELEIPGLKLEPFRRERTESKFDITLFAFEKDDKIVLSLEYATGLFKGETIDRFIACFNEIVSAVTRGVDIELSDVEIISEEEKLQILKSFNNTEAVYPKEETIISLFEKQVRKTPSNPAIKVDDKELSYLELDELSNKIASYLKEAEGVCVGDMVGIMLGNEEYIIPSI